MKWRPLKYLTRGFGAVKLTRTAGLKLLPRPDFGGPSSIFQDDGASTDVTGSLVSSRAWITAGNGSLTSPEKLNPGDDQLGVQNKIKFKGITREYEPKMASTM